MPRRRHRHKKTGKPPPDEEPGGGDSTALLEDENYVVKHSDTLGRYLVAKRDVPEGTVIISEQPLAVGPLSDSAPICLGCYTQLPNIDTADRCKGCKWPLCSHSCKGLHKPNGHSKEECAQLTTCPIESAVLTPRQLYNVVFPLRCLLLRDHHADKWSILSTMESHNDQRRAQPGVWGNNQQTVVDRIRKEWHVDKYTEEEIHTVCGYIEINSFSIGSDAVNIQGLYPKAFFIAHDCIANTSHTDDEEFHLRIFISTKLSEGDIITLSYTNSLQATHKRREHLVRCKYFECSCKRCSDPTELGTYFSALRCRACSSGRVLPTEPLRHEVDWQCDNKECHRSHPAAVVLAVVERIDDEIKQLDQASVKAVEAAILHYENLLWPSHYHIVGLKYSLSQLYGKAPGFLISQMNEATLQRKIQICEDILKVFDVVEPGFTRVRAITMYELHAPLMILTMQQAERRNVSKVDLTKVLKRVAFLLRESIKLLKFEPKNSQEGAIRKAAEEALAQLKSWEPAVGKL